MQNAFSKYNRKQVLAMAFQKAKREQIWAKILLNSPSGGGKSYSALRLATGMARKCGSRVAAIDTENGRIRYYANEFDFDDMQLAEPYSPEKYIEAIDEAVKAGYKVLVVDSISHEWNFCLDLVNNMPGSNSYTKWKSVTPRHNAFMEKILQAPIHIIATVRGKDEYVLEDTNGKKVPKKVGLGYTQRDGAEFNYTVTLNLDQSTHRFSATKDNTHLFEDRYDVLTEADGEAIYDWANSGEVPAPKTKNTAAPATTAATANDVPSKIIEIDAKVKKLQANGVSKDDIVAAIKNVMVSTANYNRIEDFKTADAVLANLNDLEEN